MKLYLISQEVNNEYDTFDSAIVAANSAEHARFIHPACYANKSTWCDPEDVKVVLVGTATLGTKAGVILASFNAGQVGRAKETNEAV
jgi:hypothetical protein